MEYNLLLLNLKIYQKLKTENVKKGIIIMICNSCYHQPICEGQPGNENWCNLYLRDGEIDFGHDISLNPINMETFDYDDIKRFFTDKSIDETLTNLF